MNWQLGVQAWHDGAQLVDPEVALGEAPWLVGGSRSHELQRQHCRVDVAQGLLGCARAVGHSHQVVLHALVGAVGLKARHARVHTQLPLEPWQLLRQHSVCAAAAHTPGAPLDWPRSSRVVLRALQRERKPGRME